MPTTGAHPFIHIEQQPDPDDPTGFNLDVKAGNGIDSTDDLVTVLLLVVENITGVSSDLYAQEIDIVRGAAARGEAMRRAAGLPETDNRCPGRVVAYADGRTGRCMKGAAGHPGECA